MATIGNLLTGLMATAVIGGSAYALAPVVADAATQQTDQVIGGARVSQVAISLGNQVRKAESMGIQIDTLTCATPRCNQYVELDGYKIGGSYSAVSMIRKGAENFTVSVTSKGGTTTAVYDSTTRQVATVDAGNITFAYAPDTNRASPDYVGFGSWIVQQVRSLV